MRISFDADLLKQLEELRKRDCKLFKRLDKTLEFYRSNPEHKSLRLHKLSGALHDRWSISVGMKHRLIFVKMGDEIYFFEFGTHDEVYRK